MNIKTMETRDCLQCGHTDSPCGGHVYESLVELSCNETITTTLQFNIDGKDLEEIKVETMQTLPIKGYPECVCWRQEMGTRTFRRPHDLVGFSTDPEMTMPGKYRMINSARKLVVEKGDNHLKLFKNKFSNHNFWNL